MNFNSRLSRLIASKSFTATAHRVLPETGTYGALEHRQKKRCCTEALHQLTAPHAIFLKVPETSAYPRNADGEKILVRADAALLKDIRCMDSQAVCQHLANVVSQRPAGTAIWLSGDGAGLSPVTSGHQC